MPILSEHENLDNKLSESIEAYPKNMLPFSSISNNTDKHKSFPNMLDNLRLPIDMNSLVFTKKEDVEEIKELLKKAINEEKIETKNSVNKNKILLQANNWEEVEIKFKDKFTIEIYINENHVKTINYEEIGFCGNGKDKKPNAQWNFLYRFSGINSFKKEEATKQFMVSSLEKKEANIDKIKSKLSKKLKELFGLNDDPFYIYKDYGYYNPKFKIKPIPGVRGDGKLLIFTSQYIDNIDYEEKEDNFPQ
ncbi:MAG: hypothetical protein WC472_04665 [Candidatus Paceibacterota bacterium]